MLSSIFIPYYFKFFLTLIICYGLGAIALPQKQDRPFYNVFFNCFLAAIFLTSSYALWQAAGITIMGGFVIWLILWYLRAKTAAHFLISKGFPKFQSLKAWSSPNILCWLALSGIFLWAFYSRTQGSPFPFVIPEGTALAPNDIHVYTQRSFYLGLTGQENYFGIYNTFDSSFHGPKPYHYLELWLNAVIGRLFGGLNVLNLSLITGPFFQALAFLGILALWERITTIKWHHILLGFAFLWVAGLYLFYQKIGFPAFSLPVMNYRFKMVVYYPFLMGFVLCALEKEWEKSFLMLLGLPLASIVPAPAVLGGLTLFAILSRIGKFEVQLQIRKLLSAMLLIFGFIGAFYWLAKTGSTATTFEVKQSELAGNFQLQAFIKNLLYGPLHLFVLYWPYLILWGLFWQTLKVHFNEIRPALILSACLILSGAGSWALLNDFAQSSQLFYNLSVPLLNVWGIVIFQLLFRPGFMNKAWKAIFAIGLFVLILGSQWYLTGKTQFAERSVKNYSPEYLLRIESLVQSGQLSPIGGAIKGPEDYRSEYSKMAAGYTLGYYLLYMKNGYATVSMSDFAIPINPEDRRNNLKDVQSGAFYQFVERQKNQAVFHSLAQSQLDFIKANHINFLIVTSSGKLPENLHTHISRKIIDPISGEQFILLQHL